MAKKKKKKRRDLSCVECGARCCRYVATQIDKPSSKREYDNIRWYLLHDGVSVFVDREGDWYLEFKSDCTALRDDSLCGNYANRPRICREHGESGNECEFDSDQETHVYEFSTAGEFERYLDDRKIKWCWKKKGATAEGC